MKEKPTMASHTANPLYEKLCSRFSYNGQSVGEMMRSRASGNSFPIGSGERCDLHSITVESHITKANFLPSDGGEAVLPSSVYRSSPICEKRTLLTLLAAIVLCLSFVLFLSFSALSQRNNGHTLPSLELHEAEEMMVLREEVLPSL